FFFQAEDGIRDFHVTGVQTCALPISTERLVLNCLQRMSGIATKTHHFSTLICHTKAKLLDTRKTTPNFRLIEKWAVALGGGENQIGRASCREREYIGGGGG